MLTFEQMWDDLDNGGPVSVLLGNGFSRAWRKGTFGYKTLYHTAQLGSRDTVIRNVFQKLNTYDFERVTSRLRSAARLLKAYGKYGEFRKQLLKDAGRVRRALLRAITDTHPARPDEITLEEYTCVRKFLSRFSSIYTVNYDLLMYWSRNQEAVEPLGWQTDDGFRVAQAWVGPDTQNVFFLHGALHLYQDQDGVKKHAFVTQQTPIIDSVSSNLKKGIFPLFVSEPSAKLKRREIKSNPYLNYCFDRLTKERGAMLIFGHQLADIDRHILDGLNGSKLRQIYVSIYGNRETEKNKRTQANAKTYLSKSGRIIRFVDAGTVPVWRPV